MSRDASLELDWADGRYTFRLAWAELEQLQEACDAGPYVILNRLIDGSWRIADISNVIRLGLVGGGMAPLVALKNQTWKAIIGLIGPSLLAGGNDGGTTQGVR